MTLRDAKPGDGLVIQKIDDDVVRVQAIRLGLVEGSSVKCIQKIWGGPVVIAIGNQEMAIGAKLAERIAIKTVNAVGWEGKPVAVS